MRYHNCNYLLSQAPLNKSILALGSIWLDGNHFNNYKYVLLYLVYCKKSQRENENERRGCMRGFFFVPFHLWKQQYSMPLPNRFPPFTNQTKNHRKSIFGKITFYPTKTLSLRQTSFEQRTIEEFKQIEKPSRLSFPPFFS